MKIRLLPILITSFFLASCGKGDTTMAYPEYTGMNQYSTDAKEISAAQRDNLLADDGAVMKFFKSVGKEGDAPIGVSDKNSLWIASLETLSFMPLASTDKDSGMIITDWYALPEDPTVRYKINALVKPTGDVGINAFKQSKKSGSWTDVSVPEGFADAIQYKILQKASTYSKKK